MLEDLYEGLKLRGKKLIKEFYKLNSTDDSYILERFEFAQDGFIIKEKYKTEEFWCFYNLDIFIEQKFQGNLDKHNQSNNIYKEDLDSLTKDEWTKKYGNILYKKETLKELKQDILKLDKLCKNIVTRQYIKVINKEGFNISKFLDDYINNQGLMIDDSNLIIARFNNKIVRLGINKEKVLKEIKWGIENSKKSNLELMIPIKKGDDNILCVNLILASGVIKIGLAKLYNKTKNIEYLKINIREKEYWNSYLEIYNF